jgi:uncharacterized protein (TIRG00374 family)
MERFQRPLIISVLIAIGLYFAALFLGDFAATREAILKVPMTGWLIILGLSLFNYLLRYLRWQWYIRALTGIVLPHRLHAAYYVCGFALSTTPGKAGETVRSLYLKKHGIQYAQSISAFFVERFLDLLAIVLLSVLAAHYFADYRILVAVCVGLVLLALPLIHSQRLLSLGDELATRVRPALGKVLGHLLELLRSSAVLLRNQALYGGLALGLLAWGAEGLGLWYLLSLLGHEVDLLLAVSVYGVAVLVGAVSFLPGGLGSTELVMGLLLVAMGVDKADAVAATLICRIATLWFAVFLGLGVAGGLTLRGDTPGAIRTKI